MKKILIVCNGNIHRSVVAVLCVNKALRKLNLENQYKAISRGLQGSGDTQAPRFPNIINYPLEWSITEPLLREIGVCIDLEQKATPVMKPDVADASLVLAMDGMVLVGFQNSLVKQFSQFGFKMRLYQELAGKVEDIPDCMGSSDINLYRNVILAIDNVARNRINYAIELAEQLS